MRIILIYFTNYMNRIIILIIEVSLIISGGFAINSFVENVLDPNYTSDWQSRAEWEAGGCKGGIPRDKKVYEKDIIRKRKTDRLVLFLLYGFFIVGYYCAKSARKEVKQRGKIIPADGTEYLDIVTISSNRRIALFRFLAFLCFMLVLVTFITVVSGHPMQNINESGQIVNTNPYFGKNSIIGKLPFMLFMPFSICFIPYFVLKDITTVFSFKFCSLLFLTFIIIMGIGTLLRVPVYAASAFATLFSGLSVFKVFLQKMNAVSKALGY